MEDAPKPTRKRRWLKRISIALGVLFVLFTIFLFAADGYRRAGMKERRVRLQTALERVETEILKGKTPNEWHESRITGTNGWRHIEPLFTLYERTHAWHEANYDAEVEPDFIVLSNTLDELTLYHSGDWMPDPEEYPDLDEESEPPPDRIERWMKITNHVASAVAAAAACDCVVRLAEADEPYPEWNGVALFPRSTLNSAMMARCKILLDWDERARAVQELHNLSTLWSKVSTPTCWIETLVHLMVWADTVEFARDLLIDGHITASEARSVLNWKPDVYPRIRSACEGEAVWLYTSSKAADYALYAPSMFDWVSGDIPTGTGMFKQDFDPFRAAYFGPGNLTVEVAMAVENAMHWVNISRTPPPWNPEDVPIVEESLLFALNPSHVFGRRNEVFRKSLHWLELELRILEHERGPLRDKREAVDKIAARYPDSHIGWDGDSLALGINPRLLESASLAYARDPEKTLSEQAELIATIRERFKSDSEPDDGWEIWIHPIDEVRASRTE